MPRPLQGAALTSHETKTSPAPPAPKGNTRAAKHGAGSPKLVQPGREAHLRVLREDYPDVDQRRLTLLADRLARIDLASAWIEKQRSIVRNKDGDTYNIAVLVDRWSAAAERAIRELEQERRKPKRVDLAQEMSALADDAECFDANDETLNG